MARRVALGGSAVWALLAVAGALLAGCAAIAAEPGQPTRRSGFDFMSPPIQAMQADDGSNPGMLWVLEGERLWQTPVGDAGKSCASCHGAARRSMRGVAARYPAYDEHAAGPIDLAGRVGQCRAQRQAAALARDGDELLALTAWVAHQSRGMPVTPAEDPRLAAARERGRRWFERPLGQLQLACASCHQGHAGARLGGSIIPQGHPTGYPLYRLEWQSLGSLQRRVRGCLAGVRAEPFEPGAPEYLEIELYLMWRAAGMPMETPAVRP